MPLLDDGFWGLNKIQEWLWARWLAFQQAVLELAGPDPFDLLVNGDAIEGRHHGTTQLVHADPSVQARIAVGCLKPLAELANRVFLTVGTNVHVGSSEYSIGDKLNAEKHPDTDLRAAQNWQIDYNGCLVSARHHIGTSGRAALYATQLSVRLAEERTQALNAGHRVPDFLVRSHRHTAGYYASGSAGIITTPAWQVLTEHGHKVVGDAVPVVGGFFLDWRGLPKKALPVVHVEELTWQPAQPGIVTEDQNSRRSPSKK